MKTLTVITLQLVLIGFFLLTGCLSDPQSQYETRISAEPGFKLALANNLSAASLKASPETSVSRVNIHIKQVELKVSRNDSSNKTVTMNLYNNQQVNLIDLAQDFSLDLAHVQGHAGLRLQQIRLILEDSENYILTQDGQRCDLETPSQQHTGLKVIVPGGIVLQSDLQYKLTFDLDLAHSLVYQGNGSCLLKPVLKIGSIEQILVEDPTPATTTTTTVAEVPPPTTTIADVPVTTTTVVPAPSPDPTDYCDDESLLLDPVNNSDFWVCF